MRLQAAALNFIKNISVLSDTLDVQMRYFKNG